MGNLLKADTAIIRAILDIESLTWDSTDRVPYSGPWALCDRAAQSQAGAAEKNAAGTAATESGAAQNASAALTPFYKSEMNDQHGFDPAQTQELLNYAGAGTGGSAATTMGQAQSEAAHTRNTSGFSSALDKSAQDRTRAMADVNAGIGAQDVLGAKQLNQQGAAGMSGLYNTDTSAMLSAMGQEAPDINAETNAGNSGWFQNLMGTMKTLPGFSKSDGFGGGFSVG